MREIRVDTLTRDEFEAMDVSKAVCSEDGEDAGHLACVLSDGTVLAASVPLGNASNLRLSAFEYADGTILCVAFGSACLIERGTCASLLVDGVKQIAIGHSVVALADDTEIYVIKGEKAWMSSRISYDGIDQLQVHEAFGMISAEGYNAPSRSFQRVSISLEPCKVLESAYP